jgi:hypothetical protein
MHTFTHFARRRAFEIALVVCVAQLAWLMLARAEPEAWGVLPSLRNTNFPHTHIGRIDLDLKGPNHWVRVEWRGPDAAGQDVGPFRSSPGAGWGTNDCNDPVESNCPDSRCTPKGVRKVEGFADHLKDSPVHRYVTWIDKRRAIGFHSCPAVEPFPASAGCVRLEPYAARLIHDNSIAGRTEIVIDGTWTNPRSAAGEWPQKGTKAHKEKIRGTLISANSH